MRGPPVTMAKCMAGGANLDRRPHCATLCVMTERPRVGVRELRQNLSVYLRRVGGGETLEVTDRGNPVALLTPLPERSDPIARLAADGRVTAASRDLREIGPPLEIELEKPLSTILDELREDRI